MPVIKPTSVNYCKEFIRKNKDDVLKGVYRIEIFPYWIPKLDENDLLILAKSERGHDAKLMLAESKDIPVSVIETLARDSNSEIRRLVAGNQKTPVSVLEKLANDSDSAVRHWVSGNVNTPTNLSIEILKSLAKSQDYKIRCWIAGNPNTPTNVLEDFASDVFKVQLCLAGNNNAPPHALVALSKNSDSRLRIAVAQNIQ